MCHGCDCDDRDEGYSKTYVPGHQVDSCEQASEVSLIFLWNVVLFAISPHHAYFLFIGLVQALGDFIDASVNKFCWRELISHHEFGCSCDVDCRTIDHMNTKCFGMDSDIESLYYTWSKECRGCDCNRPNHGYAKSLGNIPVTRRNNAGQCGCVLPSDSCFKEQTCIRDDTCPRQHESTPPRQKGLYASLFTNVNMGDLGEVALSGTLSSDPTKGLSVSGIVNLKKLLGGIDINGHLETRVNSQELFVKVTGSINLGLLGEARIVGTIDSSTGHVSLYAGIDVGLFGLRVCGQLAASYESNQYTLKATLLLRLGFLGNFYLGGQIDNSGVAMTASVSPGKSIKTAIRECIKTIVNVTGMNGLLKEAVNAAVETALNAFSLDSVQLTLDTRTGNKKIEVKLDVTLLGSSHSIVLRINFSSRRYVSPSLRSVIALQDLESAWGGHQSPWMEGPEDKKSEFDLTSFNSHLESLDNVSCHVCPLVVTYFI